MSNKPLEAERLRGFADGRYSRFACGGIVWTGSSENGVHLNAAGAVHLAELLEAAEARCARLEKAGRRLMKATADQAVMYEETRQAWRAMEAALSDTAQQETPSHYADAAEALTVELELSDAAFADEILSVLRSHGFGIGKPYADDAADMRERAAKLVGKQARAHIDDAVAAADGRRDLVNEEYVAGLADAAAAIRALPLAPAREQTDERDD